MKSKLMASLAGVVLYAVAAEAAIHETWQIAVSGILNGDNYGQVDINNVLYSDDSFAFSSYEDGVGILNLAYNGTFTGTITLEVQYKESEYTPGEYEMDHEFGNSGWLVTDAEIHLPTSVGGVRTFAVDFTTASYDSYRSLDWFNDADEYTMDFPNGHPEIHEVLRHAFPVYEGPGGYYDCSYMGLASQNSAGNVWASLKWYEDVDGQPGMDAIILGLNNITMTANQIVPEPATMALLVLGSASLIYRRKR